MRSAQPGLFCCDARSSSTRAIGYQAVSQDSHTGVLVLVADEVEVDLAIAGLAEDILAVGAALRNVISVFGNFWAFCLFVGFERQSSQLCCVGDASSFCG